MSWLSYLLLAGVVFVSGTDLSTQDYRNINSTSKNKKSVIVKKAFDETERFEKTYSFNPQGKIDIYNINGSITIEAWDRPEINLVATKVADSKERLSDVQIEIEESQNRFSLKTNYKSWKNRNRGNKYKKYSKLEVNFKLKVPRTAVLDEIESVNGSVRVSNMTNYTEISAVNGTVLATNLRGTAKLSTVNGSVNAGFDSLNRDSVISLGTVNGSVKLSIPSSANATVRADTVNGSIRNAFGLPVRKGKYVGRDLYGRIGTGEVKIKLNSVNGALIINRNNDGGTTNPAVNLLKQKNSRDFDESFEMDMSRVNKSVRKSMKESKMARKLAQKEVAKAMKEAEKAVAKVSKQSIIDAEKFRVATEAISKEAIEKRTEAELFRNNTELKRLGDTIRLAKSPYIIEKNGKFDVQGIPNVKITADNCSVVVRGWNKSEVGYSITRTVRNKNQEAPSVNVSHHKSNKDSEKGDSRVEIKVSHDVPDVDEGRRNKNNVVRVEVFVPKKSNLRIRTNKDIRLEGVSGSLRLFGEDNSINVRDADGELRAFSADGMIRVIGFNGKVWTETTDGKTMLEGKFDKIYSKTVDGDITVTLPQNTDAKIFSNVDASIEGFNNAQENSKKRYWILGEGGSKYSFTAGEDAKVLIRNKDSIDTN